MAYDSHALSAETITERSDILTRRVTAQQLQTLASSIEPEYAPCIAYAPYERWQRRRGYTYGFGLRLKNPPRFWPSVVVQQAAWLQSHGYPYAAWKLLELHAPRWDGADQILDLALPILEIAGGAR